MSFNNVLLGHGIGREIESKERELEQLLTNLSKELDQTINTARKYWPNLFS